MSQKEINIIKKKMIDGLEEPQVKKINGEKTTVLNGDYVCHEDIPGETPIGFDSHFTVCGEDENHTYLVLIQKIYL